MTIVLGMMSCTKENHYEDIIVSHQYSYKDSVQYSTEHYKLNRPVNLSAFTFEYNDSNVRLITQYGKLDSLSGDSTVLTWYELRQHWYNTDYVRDWIDNLPLKYTLRH